MRKSSVLNFLHISNICILELLFALELLPVKRHESLKNPFYTLLYMLIRVFFYYSPYFKECINMSALIYFKSLRHYNALKQKKIFILFKRDIIRYSKIWNAIWCKKWKTIQVWNWIYLRKYWTSHFLWNWYEQSFEIPCIKKPKAKLEANLYTIIEWQYQSIMFRICLPVLKNSELFINMFLVCLQGQKGNAKIKSTYSSISLS